MNAMKVTVSIPQGVSLFFSEIIVRPVDWKTEFFCIVNQLLLPFRHLITFPADYGIIINRKIPVGHNQVLVNPYYFAVPFALRTGSHRIIEAEHVL